ncbi:MAG TPA: hypothetical protein VEY71_07000, partial [Chitinophagales bacterium]|nr:hypothetical protein [Chitinophagales bacterium]
MNTGTNTNALTNVTRFVVSSCVLLSLVSASFRIQAQSLPDTDIFLLPITQTADGVSLGAGRVVTAKGKYDDQPSFSFDGQYMYYAAEADDYKTDIHAVYLPQYQNVEFIVTGSISEYHPLQKPDMTGVSLVRHDPASGTRQVWLYNTDGTEKNLTPNLTDVDRFIWLNDTTLALRLAGESNALVLHNTKTNEQQHVASHIGKSIGKVPSENGIYFTQTVDGVQKLMRRYYDSGKTDTLVFLPGGSTEFSVAVDGSLW